MLNSIIAFIPIGQLWKPTAAMSIEALIIGIIVVIVLLLLQALLVMIFWNLTLPHIFPTVVPCISYWQALGLVLLVAALFP